MRDKTHGEFIEKWAEYVRTNSDWKKHHTEFINAQFQMTEAFIQRLLKQKGGREKIIQIYGIKNLNAFPNLLK